MRPIKFRAWDQEYKKMRYVMEFINLAVDGVQMVKCYQHHDRPLPASIDEYEIMQFTGLLDNTKFESQTEQEQKEWLKTHIKEEWKGKEIYEGDIIDVGILDEKGKVWMNRIAVVDFIQGEFVRNYSLSPNLQDKHLNPHPLFDKNKIQTIIGNIYENPELLKS